MSSKKKYIRITEYEAYARENNIKTPCKGKYPTRSEYKDRIDLWVEQKKDLINKFSYACVTEEIALIDECMKDELFEQLWVFNDVYVPSGNVRSNTSKSMYCAKSYAWCGNTINRFLDLGYIPSYSFFTAMCFEKQYYIGVTPQGNNESKSFAKALERVLHYFPSHNHTYEEIAKSEFGLYMMHSSALRVFSKFDLKRYKSQFYLFAYCGHKKAEDFITEGILIFDSSDILAGDDNVKQLVENNIKLRIMCYAEHIKKQFEGVHGFFDHHFVSYVVKKLLVPMFVN